MPTHALELRVVSHVSNPPLRAPFFSVREGGSTPPSRPFPLTGAVLGGPLFVIMTIYRGCPVSKPKVYQPRPSM